MTSYSVKDRSYYELDQEKRAKERLIKRSKEQIEKLKETPFGLPNVVSTLSNNSLSYIDSLVKTITKNIITISNNFEQVFDDASELDYYTITNITALKTTLTEIGHLIFNLKEIIKRINSLFKSIDMTKIPDLIIFQDDLQTFLKYWNDFFDRFRFFIVVEQNAIIVQESPFDRNDFELFDLTKGLPIIEPGANVGDPPAMKAYIRIDNFDNSGAIDDKNKYSLFYKILEIEFNYIPVITTITTDLKEFIKKYNIKETSQLGGLTQEPIKSGSGFAIPHHKTLNQYVQNHSNQLPQRFL